MHHELFHLLDHFQGTESNDPKWLALNPPSFRYGTGGFAAQDVATSWVLQREFPGVVSKYALAGADEDKAELFSAMMTSPDFVVEACKEDPILDNKVKLLCERLLEFDKRTIEGFPYQF
jgi:hypothetical protein